MTKKLLLEDPEFVRRMESAADCQEIVLRPAEPCIMGTMKTSYWRRQDSPPDFAVLDLCRYGPRSYIITRLMVPESMRGRGDSTVPHGGGVR